MKFFKGVRVIFPVLLLAGLLVGLQGCGGGGNNDSSSTKAAKAKIYMSANDGVSGYELYTSDGTAKGTVLVKDINSIGSSNPRKLVEMNGVVYFCADDGVHIGFSLWKTDGTSNGTKFVSAVNPCASGNNSVLTPPVVIGNTFYFSGQTSATGKELWKSDGTTAGTVIVKDINPGVGSGNPYSVVTMAGNLYFTATNTTDNYELWKSDGTTSGTILLKDINPGTTNSSFPRELLVIGQSIYFSAFNPSYGSEIWHSDGTAAGTKILLRLNTGTFGGSPVGSYPMMLTRIGNRFFFTASDIPPAPNSSRLVVNGLQLWVSDGTTTTKLIELAPPSGGGGSYPGHLTAVGNTLFFSGYTSAAGTELWKSDGTVAGTVLVKDINSGAGPGIVVNAYQNLFFALNDFLYFPALDLATGIELWKSDGSIENTVLVRDINATSVTIGSDIGVVRGSSGLESLQYSVLGSTAYFSANDGINGIELWKTDGTKNGTKLVKDLNLGSSNGVNAVFN